jgi:protein DGCR14
MMRNGEGSTRGRPAEAEDVDELDGSVVSGKTVKRRKPDTRRVRDDLTLDAFQRNYTSEDNASFVQIVDEENRRRQEDRWGWAWEAERKAEQRRIEGEDRRRLLLEDATGGSWKVDGNGRRLLGGLAEGGTEKEDDAWKDVKLIGAVPLGSSTETAGSGALVVHSTSTALVRHTMGTIPTTLEAEIPKGHPLRQALTDAGLPATALLSHDDGAVVPHREITSGEGEGRGRGIEDRISRERAEAEVLGDEEAETIPLGGSGADQWGYKVSGKPSLADPRP